MNFGGTPSYPATRNTTSAAQAADIMPNISRHFVGTNMQIPFGATRRTVRLI